jgi:hypothetical protein
MADATDDDALVMDVARAIAAAERDVYPPDRFDNILSWAEEVDAALENRCKRRGGVLETQRDNRRYCQREIERWRRQARAALAVAVPVVRERAARTVENLVELDGVSELRDIAAAAIRAQGEG